MGVEHCGQDGGGGALKQDTRHGMGWGSRHLLGSRQGWGSSHVVGYQTQVGYQTGMVGYQTGMVGYLTVMVGYMTDGGI